MSTSCPQCDGTGLDGFGGGEEDAPCPWCNGTGKVSEAVYEAWAEEMDRNTRRGGPEL